MKFQSSFINFVIKKYKWRAALFLLTIIIAAFLELFLVSLIYRLTSLLLGGTDTAQSIFGAQFTLESFSAWFLVVAVLATVMRIAIIIYQAENMALISNGLVENIYKELINKSLIKYKELPDSEIISLLTTKVQHCTDNILLQASQIISAFLISTGIIVALLIMNISTTVLVFTILVLIYFIIMKVSKLKLKAASVQLSRAHDEKNKLILNTNENIEALMAYGQYAECINAMAVTDAKLRNSQKMIAIFGAAPRFLIEGIIIIFSSLPLLYYSSKNGLEIADVAFIGAFMVGAIRLLPLVNQIYAGLTSIRGSEHVARDIMHVLNQKSSKKYFRVSHNENKDLIVDFKNIQINLDGSLISYPNFSIFEGESLAIVGRSGSGKSKLLHTLLRLIETDTGELVNSCFDEALQKNIGVGYATQRPVVISDSISNTVASGAYYDQDKIDMILDLTLIKEEIANRENIGESGSLLSGGQLQRLALCNALYRSTRLLILDEPTSALNSEMSKKVIRNILDYCAANSVAVICVTHDFEVAKLFNKRIEIK